MPRLAGSLASRAGAKMAEPTLKAPELKVVNQDDAPNRDPDLSPDLPPSPESRDPNHLPERPEVIFYQEVERKLYETLEALNYGVPADPQAAAITRRMQEHLREFVLGTQAGHYLDEERAPAVRERIPAAGRPTFASEGQAPAPFSFPKPRHAPRSPASSSSSSSTSTTESEDSDPPRRVPRHVRPSSERRSRPSVGLSDAASLPVELLARLDSRTAPKPEPFHPQSGRSLRDFFQDFEAYCEQTYKGSTAGWIGELGNYLRGEALRAFKALRASFDSYEEVRRKLLRWHKQGVHHRRSALKRQFAKATRETGEPVRLWAPRLRNLFQLAYPRRNPEKSSALRDRFLATIPRSYRHQVQSALNLARVSGQGRLRWKQIERLVATMEEDGETDYLTEGPCLQSAAEVFPQIQPVRRPGREGTRRVFTSRNYHPGRTPQMSLVAPNSQTLCQSGTTPASPCHLVRDPPGTARCSWCNLPGHTRERCRRYNNLCLACGSQNHFLTACDQAYRRQPRLSRRGPTSPPRGRNPVENSPHVSPRRRNRTTPVVTVPLESARPPAVMPSVPALEESLEGAAQAAGPPLNY